MACVKHLALNSMENARFRVDVRTDERTLHEVYLPHFRRCLEAGAASVMSAYNRFDGRFCGHQPRLLRRILKERWGFDGFVMSDFVLGVRGPGGLAGGVDRSYPSWVIRVPARVSTQAISRFDARVFHCSTSAGSGR